jgi:uncharacterized protein (TIGR00266 family)
MDRHRGSHRLPRILAASRETDDITQMTPADFKIEGSDLQFVRVALPAGARMVGEPGSMMYLQDGISIDTQLGDGVDEGFFARVAGAFKRWATGENMFSTIFENRSSRPLQMAFAAGSPGKILAIDLAAHGGQLICQKRSFLAGTQGVRVGMAFKKRLRVGFFGGEGFILQRITGNGVAFIHATGALSQINLAPGQALQVDTGCLAALQSTVTYDIKYVGKIKTTLFGGEGMFFAHLKGPGTVWLQSLPIRRLVKELNTGARPQGVRGRLLYFLLVVTAVLLAIFGEGGA